MRLELEGLDISSFDGPRQLVMNLPTSDPDMRRLSPGSLILACQSVSPSSAQLPTPLAAPPLRTSNNHELSINLLVTAVRWFPSISAAYVHYQLTDRQFGLFPPSSCEVLGEPVSTPTLASEYYSRLTGLSMRDVELHPVVVATVAPSPHHSSVAARIQHFWRRRLARRRSALPAHVHAAKVWYARVGAEGR